VAAYDERLASIKANGESLVAKEHPQAADIQSKVDSLAAEREQLGAELDARKKAVDDALALFKFNGAAADAEAALKATEAKLANREAPADVAVAEEQLRELDNVKTELEANSRRVAAVEVVGERSAPPREVAGADHPRGCGWRCNACLGNVQADGKALTEAGHSAAAEIAAKVDALRALDEKNKEAWAARRKEVRRTSTARVRTWCASHWRFFLSCRCARARRHSSWRSRWCCCGSWPTGRRPRPLCRRRLRRPSRPSPSVPSRRSRPPKRRCGPRRMAEHSTMRALTPRRGLLASVVWLVWRAQLATIRGEVDDHAKLFATVTAEGEELTQAGHAQVRDRGNTATVTAGRDGSPPLL